MIARSVLFWCLQYKMSSDDIDKLMAWKHTAY